VSAETAKSIRSRGNDWLFALDDNNIQVFTTDDVKQASHPNMALKGKRGYEKRRVD